MKKIIIFLFTIIGTLAIFSGCTDNSNDDPYDTSSPICVYRLLEECKDSVHYCTFNSVEITSSYAHDESAQEGGSGYYVIIGADTNLSKNDMSDSDNKVKLVLERNETIELKFLTWDAKNGKLICEIPYIESLDYLQLCNLKASDNNNYRIPALYVRIKYFYLADFMLTLE